METLKKFFPHAFKVEDVATMIVNILIYLLVAVAGALIIWLVSYLTSWIPLLGGLIGIICTVLGAVVDIYAVAGIVITVLVYLKVLK